MTRTLLNKNSFSFVADIAVEGLVYHFDAPYSYLIPESLEQRAFPGCRVMIPFGRGNRKKQGLILSTRQLGCDDNADKLKAVEAVLDEAPLFNSEMLSLIGWLKENTFCTLFEAARAMLPAGIGLEYVVSYIANENTDSAVLSSLSADEAAVFAYLRGGCSFVKKEKLLAAVSLPPDSKVPEALVKKGLLLTNVDTKRKTGDLTVKNARLSVSEEELERLLPGLPVKQRNVARLLLDIGCASVKELCYFTGVTPAVVTALEKKGVIEVFERVSYRTPHSEKASDSVSPTLTASQQKAYDELLSKYMSGKGSASLLFGVTGSGKTRVFLKLIEKVVSDGRGVIVMVPEIALTPQTLGIFYSHFGDSVAVFHSALSSGERLDEWKRVKEGKAKIAIGTRSAVFAPFENLGLIVIDEEQEHTYKSEMSPRYHARDVARFRCAANNALLVLSSATPSLETYKNAIEGRYGFVKLTERYGKAVLPEVHTVDMADSRGIISTELYTEIEGCLADNKQAILLMNRRGFNTFAVCPDCKTVLSCPNCSISLTYHNANNRLMCHYCGHSEPFTQKCPECGGHSVRYSGYGTQRIEDELGLMFPNARILRMDADTTMSRHAYEEKLSAFAKGEYDIMLGTQMVAKGLDFPRVTLVGIISIDSQLYNDDFRSSEKAFDLLTQVIGRSGRGDYKGKALIQTVLPDNDIITLASAQDYEGFFATESVIRKAMLYPPYCDICTLVFTGTNRSETFSSASSFLELLKNAALGDYADVKISVLGPIQPRVSKVSNKYRFIITVKCKNTKRFRAMMSSLIAAFMKKSENADVTVTADINSLS